MFKIQIYKNALINKLLITASTVPSYNGFKTLGKQVWRIELGNVQHNKVLQYRRNVVTFIWIYIYVYFIANSNFHSTIRTRNFEHIIFNCRLLYISFSVTAMQEFPSA